tara:strand:- start:26379 stop:26729 length:351 start_codon:yes stop_codon:yes gene_type:complete
MATMEKISCPIISQKFSGPSGSKERGDVLIFFGSRERRYTKEKKPIDVEELRFCEPKKIMCPYFFTGDDNVTGDSDVSNDGRLCYGDCLLYDLPSAGGKGNKCVYAEGWKSLKQTE